MPAEWQPHLAGLYVNAEPKLGSDGVAQVHVDADRPDAWREGVGADVVGWLVGNGTHVIVVAGKQVNFVAGAGRQMPEKLILEWLL